MGRLSSALEKFKERLFTSKSRIKSPLPGPAKRKPNLLSRFSDALSKTKPVKSIQRGLQQAELAKINFNRTVRPKFSSENIQSAIRQTAPTVARDFGNVFRKTTAKTPFRGVGRAVAKTGESIGSGAVDIASIFDPKRKKFNLSTLSKAARGTGRILAPATSIFQAANIVSSLDKPDERIDKNDRVRRTASGILQGITGKELTQNVPSKNVNIKLPVLGDVEFDPLKTAGSFVGFTQNPINKQIFKLTNKFFPTKGGTFKRWLTTTGIRGGIEDLILFGDQIPDDGTPSEKLSALTKIFGEGVVSEIIGQGIIQGGGKVIKGVGDTGAGKKAVKEINALVGDIKDFVRKANTPVSTFVGGEKVFRPLYKVEIEKALKSSSPGFAKLGPKQLKLKPQKSTQLKTKLPEPKIEAPKDDPLDLVKQAIDSGDNQAARAILNTIEGDKPKFQTIVDEVSGVKDKAVKESRVFAKNQFGEDQALVNKFRQLLAIQGESKPKGGDLKFREHIPRKVFGISSDELASKLGKSESEFMAEITKDMNAIGGGNASKGEVVRFTKNVSKIKNLVKDLKLDKEFNLPVKDELGRTVAVRSEPGGELSKKTQRKVEQRRAFIANRDFKEWQRAIIKQEGGTRSVTGAVNRAAKEIKTRSPISDPTKLRDVSNLEAGFKDINRNFEKVYGKNFPQAKRMMLDPFDASKGKMVDMQVKLLDDLDTNIIKKFDIKKGSPESAAIQLYGEGKIKDSDLIGKFGIEKATQIKEADKWFRKTYDTLLDEVNAVMKKTYPNNPSKIIPKRNDYYRHFREMSQGFKGLFNLFDTPSNITSNLSGKSEFTKPKSKWLSFAQQRIGEKTDVDAVGGFLDYLKSASYAKHIDPHISRFRALSDELADNSDGQVNNFIEYLQDFSNDLAGKTNPLDRGFQKFIPGGRQAFRAISWLNNRVKANVILGNVSSAIAQIYNVPQGIASAGPKYSAKALGRSTGDIFKPNEAMAKSDFIKTRYASDIFNKFDTSMLDKTRNFSAWMIGALDEVGTKYIWNAHYLKFVDEGIKNPVKAADDITRKLVAGRAIGEVPLAQKSKLFQLVAPFQLEVANLWHVMKDFVSKKEFGKLATLFVANYVFNKAGEAIRGSGVVFDPIQATIDAVTEEDLTPLERGGRLAGEVLSNLPGVQNILAQVGTEEQREKFFGDQDPTRFGGGLLLTKGLEDPLSKIIPPFGGGQIKKTVKGFQAIRKGASTSKTGRVRFPVDRKSPVDVAKTLLFGEFSTKTAREHFDNDGTPLGDKDSAFINEEIARGSDPKLVIESFKDKRQFNKDVTLVKDMIKDGDLQLEDLSDEVIAEGFFQKINALNKKNQKAGFARLSKHMTPEVKKEYLKILDQSEEGLTINDRRIAALPEEIRARAVVERLEDLKSAETKKAKYDELVAAGVVTNDMKPVILKLLGK